MIINKEGVEGVSVVHLFNIKSFSAKASGKILLSYILVGDRTADGIF
jgi:hypothetical protein